MTATHDVDATREAHRRALAELLGRDAADLPDEAFLGPDLGLDSLVMMGLLTWLEARGAVVADDRARPDTVGAVLALLDRGTAFPAPVSITYGGGLPPGGPAEVPALPPSRSPLAPPTSGGAFTLTPVQPGDTDFLYWLSVQPETCFRWRYRGAPPSYERFAADLWSRVLVQFVVRRSEEGEPVGHVVAYAADSALRHAYIGAVFTPRHAGTGLAARAVSVFVDNLFHCFPLHKLYMEVPGFNWSQLSSGEGALFQVEGLLRGHDYFMGRYWDKRICAIYRDAAVDPGSP